jgi:hypothetical protein
MKVILISIMIFIFASCTREVYIQSPCPKLQTLEVPDFDENITYTVYTEEIING